MFNACHVLKFKNAAEARVYSSSGRNVLSKAVSIFNIAKRAIASSNKINKRAYSTVQILENLNEHFMTTSLTNCFAISLFFVYSCALVQRTNLTAIIILEKYCAMKLYNDIKIICKVTVSWFGC